MFNKLAYTGIQTSSNRWASQAGMPDYRWPWPLLSSRRRAPPQPLPRPPHWKDPPRLSCLPPSCALPSALANLCGSITEHRYLHLGSSPPSLSLCPTSYPTELLPWPTSQLSLLPGLLFTFQSQAEQRGHGLGMAWVWASPLPLAAHAHWRKHSTMSPIFFLEYLGGWNLKRKKIHISFLRGKKNHLGFWNLVTSLMYKKAPRWLWTRLCDWCLMSRLINTTVKILKPKKEDCTNLYLRKMEIFSKVSEGQGTHSPS